MCGALAVLVSVAVSVVAEQLSVEQQELLEQAKLGSHSEYHSLPFCCCILQETMENISELPNQSQDFAASQYLFAANILTTQPIKA